MQRRVFECCGVLLDQYLHDTDHPFGCHNDSKHKTVQVSNKHFKTQSSSKHPCVGQGYKSFVQWVPQWYVACNAFSSYCVCSLLSLYTGMWGRNRLPSPKYSNHCRPYIHRPLHLKITSLRNRFSLNGHAFEHSSILTFPTPTFVAATMPFHCLAPDVFWGTDFCVKELFYAILKK